MFHPDDIERDLEVLKDTFHCKVSHYENESIGSEYLPIYKARNKRYILVSEERALRLNMNVIVGRALASNDEEKLEEIKSCGLSNTARPEDSYYEFGYVEVEDVAGKLVIRLF